MLSTAENGSTPGGQIAVASKTGSNNLHGSVFEFLRNDVFDARQAIDTLNSIKPCLPAQSHTLIRSPHLVWIMSSESYCTCRFTATLCSTTPLL